MLAADPPNVEGARETAQRTIRDGHRASEVIARLRGLFAHKGVATEPVDVAVLGVRCPRPRAAHGNGVRAVGIEADVRIREGRIGSVGRMANLETDCHANNQHKSK